MKKRILSLALVVVMIAIMLSSFTMAYFTDESEVAKNVMTVGEIKITQNEQMKNEEGEFVDFDGTTPMFPMQDEEGIELYNKYVTVTNNSTVPVYVRTIYAFEDTNDLSYNSLGNVHCAWDGVSTGVVTRTFPSNNGDYLQIKAEDGTVYTVSYCVYVEEIPAGQTSSNTLRSVWLDTRNTNEWAEQLKDGKLDILVLSQAVQADGWAEGTTAEEALNEAFGALTADKDALVAGWFGTGYTAYNP